MATKKRKPTKRTTTKRKPKTSARRSTAKRTTPKRNSKKTTKKSTAKKSTAKKVVGGWDGDFRMVSYTKDDDRGYDQLFNRALKRVGPKDDKLEPGAQLIKSVADLISLIKGA